MRGSSCLFVSIQRRIAQCNAFACEDIGTLVPVTKMGETDGCLKVHLDHDMVTFQSATPSKPQCEFKNHEEVKGDICLQ